MMPRDALTDDVVKVLKQSGWRSADDRSGLIAQWEETLREEFVLFPAARRVLEQFGGIEVRQTGPGEECAKSSFRVDPSLAWGEGDRFQMFSQKLGTVLYPLGDIDGGHAFLAVGDNGQVFALMDVVSLVGASITDALERLVRGRRFTHVMADEV